jgi:hypothetical protein
MMTSACSVISSGVLARTAPIAPLAIADAGVAPSSASRSVSSR